jgi:enoyl-CoA hydratase/carnithine racemase
VSGTLKLSSCPLEYPGYDRRGYTYHSRLDMERRLFVDTLLRIRNLSRPTIAQVHGHCIAAGLMLACMCDLIVCDESARFANPVVAMAMAGVQLLVEPWEIGARKAKELLFIADAIDAIEAHRLGLVNRVVPVGRLEDEVDGLADRIAALPAFAVQAVKKSINDTLERVGSFQVSSANGRTPRRSSRLIFRGVTAGSDCENLESTWGYEDVLPFRLRAPTSVVAGA